MSAIDNNADDYEWEADDPCLEHNEMDRFSDEELTAIYNDPAAGGILRQYLEPILSQMPGNAIKEADEAVELLCSNLPSDTDPLFFDRQFVYAFLCAERFLSMIRDRFNANITNPLMEYSLPAFALLSYDYAAKKWLDYPDPTWLNAAAAVKWKDVLPSNRTYAVGSTGSSTAMIALKSSPIWKRLGFIGPRNKPHEPYPFTRDGSRKFIIVNVGRKELAQFCIETGFPDPSPRILARARRRK